MSNHKSMLTACGAALVALAMMASVGAWENANQTTHLTFNRPVALPGVSLPSGAYIFEMVDPVLSPDVVRVMSRDRSQVYVMTLTRRVQRPQGLPFEHQVSFREVPRGVTPPIAVWYPIGGSIGHQFIYAKNSRQLGGQVGN